MKIIRLSASNVKRLRAIEITPDGNDIVLGGKNEQGKTSILDAIQMALGGKGAVPKQPVRKGEERAEIIAELDDLIVKRTFTAAGGTSLSVSSKDGAVYKSPQAMLDKLVGSLSFDPMAFATAKPAEQSEALRKLVGIDFAALDEERRGLYEERTAVNREGKSLAAQFEAAPLHADAPEAEVSAAEIARELEAARGHNAGIDQANEDLIDMAEDLASKDAEIDDAEQQIAALKKQLETLRGQREVMQIELDNADSRCAQMQPIDLTPIQSRLDTAEDDNRRVRDNAARADLEKRLEAKRAESRSLSGQIDAIDAKKQADIAAADLPLPGLGLHENGYVTLDEIPFDQCSHAQRLRASVAMGLAMNPKLRVLLVRDGAYLDTDSLRLVAEMAAEHDAQVWIERVGEGEEVGVVIEDGSVKEVRQRKERRAANA